MLFVDKNIKSTISLESESVVASQWTRCIGLCCYKEMVASLPLVLLLKQGAHSFSFFRLESTVNNLAMVTQP